MRRRNYYYYNHQKRRSHQAADCSRVAPRKRSRACKRKESRRKEMVREAQWKKKNLIAREGRKGERKRAAANCVERHRARGRTGHPLIGNLPRRALRPWLGEAEKGLFGIRETAARESANRPRSRLSPPTAADGEPSPRFRPALWGSRLLAVLPCGEGILVQLLPCISQQEKARGLKQEKARRRFSNV